MVAPYINHRSQPWSCSYVHQRCAESLCDDMIQQSAFSHRIQLRKQKALLGLRQLADEVDAGHAKPFDLCFIDADKDDCTTFLVICVAYMMLFYSNLFIKDLRIEGI